ncbi:MAG TPA: SpoIIE family protein phosphatase [Gemmatimonadales bacterium]|nr:SpoIIE family protein phosphatase [Gemmatimonadales bacterium]
MPDAPRGLTRLDRLLSALERLWGATLRVWRYEGTTPHPLAGSSAAPPDGPPAARSFDTPEGPGWLEPVPDAENVFLEIRDGKRSGAGEGAVRQALAQIVGAVVSSEREAVQVAAELSGRYEEIDLIYTISDILGHTLGLEDAAQRILAEVSPVVRARRATLLVLDEERGLLRLVAAQGMEPVEVGPIELDDPVSVAARAFRERRTISYDPTDPSAENPGNPEGRAYRGQAFLSVPVLYGAPGGPSRPIGVINLTDRMGEDAFSAGDRKLIVAIANQVGAAIENARLVARDRGQQRMRRELELAHDLQLKLLPSPLVIAHRADVATRCRQADSVGGDFYNLLNLPGDRIGVMIGDVTSHGFASALIMALVMAASGIHAAAAESPAEALERLEQSLVQELSRTEMFLTLFFGVVDAAAGRLVYANAGHPHAFLVDGATGAASRLDATRPPLGVPAERGHDATRPWRHRREILCLFTDGIVEALGESGIERYGEERLLAHVAGLRARPVREILEAIYTDVAAFTGGGLPSDDRTLVLVRV